MSIVKGRRESALFVLIGNYDEFPIKQKHFV